ncbi:hypothetical protein LNP05_29555 [Klebsiella pneumoniae subsp. pneumoniae]|nr:hypothetical protein [Klebsiella pneumoniae subsp. pneumoniae]
MAALDDPFHQRQRRNGKDRINDPRLRRSDFQRSLSSNPAEVKNLSPVPKLKMTFISAPMPEIQQRTISMITDRFYHLGGAKKQRR